MSMLTRIKTWLAGIENGTIRSQQERIERQHRALGTVNRTVENKNAEIATLRAEVSMWKQAVIEAAVVEGPYTKEDEYDPKGCIDKMLASAAHYAESPEGNPKIRVLYERIAELEADRAKGPCPDPSEELISAIENDEVDRENDGFLTDICLAIKHNASFTDEQRTFILADLTVAQRMFRELTNAIVNRPTPHDPTNEEVEALAIELRAAHWAHHGLDKPTESLPEFYPAIARAAFEHFRGVKCQ